MLIRNTESKETTFTDLTYRFYKYFPNIFQTIIDIWNWST